MDCFQDNISPQKKKLKLKKIVNGANKKPINEEQTTIQQPELSNRICSNSLSSTELNKQKIISQKETITIDSLQKLVSLTTHEFELLSIQIFNSNEAQNLEYQMKKLQKEKKQPIIKKVKQEIQNIQRYVTIEVEKTTTVFVEESNQQCNDNRNYEEQTSNIKQPDSEDTSNINEQQNNNLLQQYQQQAQEPLEDRFEITKHNLIESTIYIQKCKSEQNSRLVVCNQFLVYISQLIDSSFGSSRQSQSEMESLSRIFQQAVTHNQIDPQILSFSLKYFQILAKNRYLHYFLIHIIDSCETSIRESVFKKATENLEELFSDQYGHKILVRIIELSSQIDEIFKQFIEFISKRLDENPIDTLTNEFGHYVIETCLRFLDDPIIEIILNVIEEHCLCKEEDKQNENYELCSNQYGCLVIQKLPKLIGKKWQPQVQKILTRIVEHSKRLAEKQFSNYLLQNIILSSEPEMLTLKSRILELLQSEFIQLAQSRYGSNVADKLVLYGDKYFQSFVSKCFEDHNLLLQVANHEFGNYVVQAYYSILDERKKEEMKITLKETPKINYFQQYSNEKKKIKRVEEKAVKRDQDEFIRNLRESQKLHNLIEFLLDYKNFYRTLSLFELGTIKTKEGFTPSKIFFISQERISHPRKMPQQQQFGYQMGHSCGCVTSICEMIQHIPCAEYPDDGTPYDVQYLSFCKGATYSPEQPNLMILNIPEIIISEIPLYYTEISSQFPQGVINNYDPSNNPMNVDYSIFYSQIQSTQMSFIIDPYSQYQKNLSNIQQGHEEIIEIKKNPLIPKQGKQKLRQKKQNFETNFQLENNSMVQQEIINHNHFHQPSFQSFDKNKKQVSKYQQKVQNQNPNQKKEQKIVYSQKRVGIQEDFFNDNINNKINEAKLKIPQENNNQQSKSVDSPDDERSL